MRQERQPQQLRPIRVTPGFSRYAEGSALVEWGHTKVLATVTVEAKLPPHLRNKKGQKGGWLTAEYALLPRSTAERSPRERLYAGGRSQEIQRFLGRALRSVTDLTLFPGQTITLDVDVLEADGGTRCAGVLAAYAAMHHAAGRLVAAGKLDDWPLSGELAAVSVGVVDGQVLLDLEYSEDVAAEVDLNVVATAAGGVVEVQGGSEVGVVEAERYVQLLALGLDAVREIVTTVRPMLK